MITNDLNISRADLLAIERTNLANERTFLAYFRTFIILISSGFAIMRLEFLHQINILGILLISISPIVLAFGIFRYTTTRKRIRSYYKNLN